MLMVRCPNCGHDMKCQPKDEVVLAGKRKQCVYCGRSFAVTSHIIKKL